MTRSLLIALVFGSILFLSSSCSTRTEPNPEEIFRIDGKVDLLFFFKKDATKEARDFFYEKELNRPANGGYWPRDGVQATFGIDRNGYEGFGIKFSKTATEQQRAEVKRIIQSSPTIYKVFENVIPTDINDL